MNRSAFHSLAILTFAAVLIAGKARAADSMLQSRPCGPDNLRGPLRLLIPQGAYGADFRPACRAHDACYDTPGSNRAACDTLFLQNMLCACEQSRHPALCRRKARMMHRATARHGEDSFLSAQAIALRNQPAE